MESSNKIHKLYFELLEKHGPAGKYWPQWCASKKSWRVRETIAIGSILTQAANWRNAELAMRKLNDHRLLSLEGIYKFGNKENEENKENLGQLIRSAGFYQQKAKRLWDLCRMIQGEYGGLREFGKEDKEKIRKRLLALSGIGPETADTILLYALDKPSFVIDEYTKRLVCKRGLAENLKYDSLKNLFEKNLPVDVKLYQDFHALIIVEQKGEKESKMERF